MDPASIIGLITAGIPVVTKLVKKVVKVKNKNAQKSINTLIPLVLGILSTGLFVYYQTGDILLAVALGLGSGGVASSARDLGKYLENLTKITKIFKK